MDNKSFTELMSTRPAGIKVEEIEGVELRYLQNHVSRFPVLVAQNASSLITWSYQYKVQIEALFKEFGAILFSGFLIDGSRELDQFAQLSGKELVDYREPSTPRTKLNDKVYSSTEYPSDQVIPLHNEQSYSNRWAQRIWFACVKPSISGGETPIADSHEVFKHIPNDIRAKFIEKGVKYVRNYGEYLDLRWEDVFQTRSRREVEGYLNKNRIDFCWKPNNGLVTYQTRPAVLVHPETGVNLWFNQAHLFHISNLDKDVADYLQGDMGIENVPRNCLYGDGSTISDDDIGIIKDVYQRCSILFPWQKNDVLMLDNMKYAHGRMPFTGDRRIVVCMADTFPSQEQRVIRSFNDAIGSDYVIVQKTRQNTASHFLGGEVKESISVNPRRALALICRILAIHNMVDGISGHVTIKDAEKPDEFWVNPFGLMFHEVNPVDVVKVNERGEITDGTHPVNVAGFCIHSEIHKLRPDIKCIVHTHPTWGTLFSTLNKTQILPIDQNACMFFEDHIIYPHYAGPVNDLSYAKDIAHFIRHHKTVILRNHGILTCGSSIEEATLLMVASENAFRVNLMASQFGEPLVIDDQTARQTKAWVANDISFEVEFMALARQVKSKFPNFTY